MSRAVWNVVVPSILISLGLQLGCSDDPEPEPDAQAPDARVPDAQDIGEGIPNTVLVSQNVQPNDDQGEQGRAFYVLDVEQQELFFFPYTTIAGGPVEGQPMHAMLTQDKRTALVTMGGDADLSLRLVTIQLDWSAGVPTASVVDTQEMVPANTPGNTANGSEGIKQEGHGFRLTTDGRFATVAELQNDRVRVIDMTTGFVGEPTSGAGLSAPHGLYLNPSATLAAAPNYNVDLDEVSIWNFNSETGAISHDVTIQMIDGDVRGGILHTVIWLDDERFITNATQDANQGIPDTFQPSVWLVNTARETAQAILDGNDLLQGVSDTVIANGKLYVAEGNNQSYIDSGKDPAAAPGYLSIWDISDIQNPTLIKRMSAGDGLPAEFANSHILLAPASGEYVFLEAYSTNDLLQIDTATDTVIRVYDEADGLDMTHGAYIQPQQP